MIKKILLGLLALIVIFVLYVLYVIFIAEPVSPPDSVSYNADGLEITVDYSRPFKKDRLIFGEKEDGALQPYGVYWRLGANNATEIEFSDDVIFGGEPVDAGRYRMYAVPGPDVFEISLNSELDVFFAVAEPDYELDVAKIQAQVTYKDQITEQLTISFSSDSTAVWMNIDWDNYLVAVPIQQ
ncbi:DUF2911 domain-containing protein [Ekhidna sp.]|uniref:DUF2911 domain-containing protein n=1 Tax=Ekhidna sp. TaxID=2608089 RepID=UPI0035137137